MRHPPRGPRGGAPRHGHAPNAYPQRPHHVQHHHAPAYPPAPGYPPSAYAYPAPPPPSPSMGMPLPLPPPLPPSPDMAPPSRPRGQRDPALERDVVAFVNALRANRSSAAAPPNALSLFATLQAIYTHFHANSLEELLGVAPKQLPVLRQIQIQNERVWSFVTCYVHARRIHTLHECHQALLQHEGVTHFQELGVGNAFALTDAVRSLYGSTSPHIVQITTKDVLTAFRQFERVVGQDAFASPHAQQQQQQHRPGHHQQYGAHVDRQQFLQFLAQQQHQPNATAMGVHIDGDGFGAYIGMMRRVAKREQKEMQELQDEFNKGIADRVFEVSKDKFSTENRQKALDDLLQQQSDEQGSSRSVTPAARGSARGKTMSSLSLDILGRVTEVDAYLDTLLRWKSADERHRSRLAAQQIASNDLKIRTQLTRFLLATQKSRHHSRIKVVTWVLCGVLAKIHAVLQLDDKLPDENEAAALDEKIAAQDEQNKTEGIDGHEDEDEEEECDCCCVGMDTCRCTCQCICHRAESDTEDKAGEDVSTERKEVRRRSRSNSMDPKDESIMPSKQHEATLYRYLDKHMHPTSLSSIPSALALLADAERHVRSIHSNAESNEVLSVAPSVLDMIVKCIAEKDEADQTIGENASNSEALHRLVEWLRSARDYSPGAEPCDTATKMMPTTIGTAVPPTVAVIDDEELHEFITAALISFQRQSEKSALVPPASREAGAINARDLRLAVIEMVCRQFGLNSSMPTIRSHLDRIIVNVQNDLSSSSKNGTPADPDDNFKMLHHDEQTLVYAGILTATPDMFERYMLHHDADDTISTGEIRGEMAEIETNLREDIVAAKTQEALRALAQCPFLVDIAEWTQWTTRFARYCGVLRVFLRSHDVILCSDDHAHELLSPSNSGSSQNGHNPLSVALRVVCCSNGILIRVREGQTASALDVEATSGRVLSPASLALSLASIFVHHGGVAEFPRELVQLHLRSTFSLERKNHSYRHGAVRNDESAITRLILETLLLLPQDMAGFFYDILVSASRVRANEANDQAVACACIGDVERQQLALLGKQMNKSAWVVLAEQKTQPAGSKCLSEESTVPETKSLAPVTSTVTTVSNTTYPSTLSSSRTELEPVRKISAASTNIDTIECESFIANLRRQQFGIGLAIADAETSAILATQHRRLERALKRLSDELYSEKTHFVLELLQNADDNTYPSKIAPSATFTLTRTHEIVFHNNECGFSRANIQAICDVGASTKENAVTDPSAIVSIGKKGIGFKSVFKVSDTPQVHSNGFHIEFRAGNQIQNTGNDALEESSTDPSTQGGLGYVLPHWIRDRSTWRTESGTTLVLPLNGSSRQRRDEIASSLLAFEPSVLLFLRRIRELRLINAVSHGRLEFRKSEVEIEPEPKSTIVTTPDSLNLEGARLREITLDAVREDGQTEQQRWLVASKYLDVPVVLQSNRSSRTEIAVALPLLNATDGDGGDDDDDDDSEEGVLSALDVPLQAVFCYLPLRTYGFRFVLQGDFEVPSSREAVLTGSEWNQWLIAQFPVLFRTVMEHVANSGCSSSLLQSILQLLPVASDIQPPFRAMVTDMMRIIRSQPCFPVFTSRDDANSSATTAPASSLLDVSFLSPSDVAFLVADPSLLAAIGGSDKRLLAPRLARVLTPALKTQLRIESLRVAHVLRVLSVAASRKSVTVIVQTLGLLSKLWNTGTKARSLQHHALWRQELRLIPCFPIETPGQKDTWRSLADVNDVLFLATSTDATTKSLVASVKSPIDAVSGNRSDLGLVLGRDLAMVRNDFVQLLDAHIDNEGCDGTLATTRHFLISHAGLKPLDDHHHVLRHHLLPKFTKLRAPQDRALWVAVTLFIAEHLRSCHGCELRNEIRACIRVWTWRDELVRIPTAADSTDLSGQPLVFIASAAAGSLSTLSSWLRRKVVQQSSPVINVVDVMDAESDPVKSRGNGSDRYPAIRALWVDTCGLPDIWDPTDTRSHTALRQIVTWLDAESDLAIKRQVSAELATHVDAMWSAASLNRDQSQGVASEGDGQVMWWESSPWLEGSDGSFYKPCALWQRGPAVDMVFPADMVPRSTIVFTSAALIQAMQLRTTPTAADALTALVDFQRKWELDHARDSSAQHHRDASETVQDLARLYTFLADQSDHADDKVSTLASITAAFRTHKLLFLPTSAASAGDAWLAVRDAVWSSSNVAGDEGAPFLVGAARFRALDRLYSRALRSFFVDVCGVARKPSVYLLCDALQALPLADVRTAAQWTQYVLPLLRELTKQLVKQESKSSQKRSKSNKARTSDENVATETGNTTEWMTAYATLQRVPWIPVRSVSNALRHKKGKSKNKTMTTGFRLVTANDAGLLVTLCDDAHTNEDVSEARDVRRLWNGLVEGMQEITERSWEPPLQMVGLGDDAAEDEDTMDPEARTGWLYTLAPLLRRVGAVSVVASLQQHAPHWTDAFARIAASIVSDAPKPQRRRLKRYQKLLRSVLAIWGRALVEEDGLTFSQGLTGVLSSAVIFPAITGDSTIRMHCGADLYVNDQGQLSQAQLLVAPVGQLSSLRVLSLFPWDYFVGVTTRDSDSGRDVIKRLLLEVAALRSLRKNLTSEIVVLGRQREAGPSFQAQLRHVLRILQRVVWHQHPHVYATLDHDRLRVLLTELRIIVVEGDSSSAALQIVDRVAAAGFASRRSASCVLEDATHTLFVTVERDTESQEVHEDRELAALSTALRETCHSCLGDACPAIVAASVANVLCMAATQAPMELETWLQTTQHVPPLDARAGGKHWLEPTTVDDQDPAPSEHLRDREPASKRRPTLEDGELQDEDSARVNHHSMQPKRVKTEHAYGVPSTTGTMFPPAFNQQPPPSHDLYPASMPTANTSMTPFSSSMQTMAGGLGGTAHMTEDERLAIGRWGEAYVFEQLQRQYGDDASRVEWVNGDQESGLPYDIVVHPSSDVGGHDAEYIEVKSTRTMEKGVFEISMNELDEASRRGSRYVIYRVFNAGHADRTRVVRMKNPVALVRQRKMQLMLLMQ